jgi:hypothetical protein
MESLRGLVAIAGIAAMYWVVIKYTALVGWKRHATALLLGALFGGSIIRLTMSSTELAAEAAEAKAQTEAREKAAQKQANDSARDALAFELSAAISSSCEDSAKAALTIPKSADFSVLQTQTRPGAKAGQVVQYNTFTYKNAFNAELEAAYLCTVDTKNFSSTKEVKVLSVKLGRP